jgi:dolichyl-phosphate beta-glucosyltransferase
MRSSGRASSATVVVPCYNEAARLRPDACLAFLREHAGFTLLFVDDGSTDGTDAVLTEMTRALPGRAERLHLPRNVGKAEAVRAGLLRALEARAPVVGFLDADLATPLSALPLLLEELERAPATEIVLGSRVKLLGRDIERSAARHYLGRCFATCVSLTLDLPVYDTQCGAKLFAASDDLARILRAPFLSRWIFDVELLARWLAVRGRSPGAIVEFPLLAWHDVRGSKLRSSDFVRATVELARIFVKYRA